MEQALLGILGGGITTDALLLLLIVAFVTRRIVPWWVHEQLIEDFEKLEATVPTLAENVAELVAIVDKYQAGQVPDDVLRRREELKHAIRRTRSTAPKTRKRTK